VRGECRQESGTVSGPHRLRLREMQPSQLYLSTEKLAAALSGFRVTDMEPVPVKRLGERIVITDGHTRAFAAHLCGAREVLAVWEEDELDWEAYAICVAWCRAAGISWVGGLVGRVVGPEEYEQLWLGRCRAMQAELEDRRRTRL